MRDFPIFTTDYGVSSLILREIPYRKEAYIRLLDVQAGGLSDHLAECISFCRMAGAEQVFAAGAGLDAYPRAAAIVEMRGTAAPDPEEVACLFPVTEQTVSSWRELHNKSMAGVDNAGTLEKRDEPRILGSTGAYFIHDNGTLLGIGWLEEGKLLAIASVIPGKGHRVMHTLMTLQEGADIVLEVASTNSKAIHLYEKLGFVKTRVITQWFSVFHKPESLS